MRIVITGVGLTAPGANNIGELRTLLMESMCGLEIANIRYMGDQVAGFCHFDELKYQNRKALRRGTRAGSVAIYCTQESLASAHWTLGTLPKSRTGVYLGITEHGNVETEQEIYALSQNNYDTKLWTHHHNPRTVANAPAGEVTISLGITGPHYTIGAACAGGNAGIIQGLQMLQLGVVDVAIAGGVSESPQSFGIFAGFAAQGALAPCHDPKMAIRPLDIDRKGTVISEGGCVFILERLEDAQKRGAPILAEIVGYAMNSDALDFVNPNSERQAECMQAAMKMANISPEQINIVNLHATGTGAGDQNEIQAVTKAFSQCPSGVNQRPYINFSKGHLGHAMGAAGAIELAGNLPSFQDHFVHPGRGTMELDPSCAIENLVYQGPVKSQRPVEYIMNNSFGMLGINSCLVVKKYVNS
ncbi:MAG: beta-ketoacyl-[acyl-carrier-protein] synthase family protein [Bacteriovoracaceae bacterium]|nr:beta-ketoacyl-[acyl-carrier-protein] synthase family protein [Bacteriovoracaceae bacterium]